MMVGRDLTARDMDLQKYDSRAPLSLGKFVVCASQDMVFDDEEHAARRKASARYRESRREIVRERSRLAMQRKRKREREEHVAAAPPPSEEAPPAHAVPPPIYIVVEDTPPLQREVAVTLDTPVEFGMRGRVIEARTPAGAAARGGEREMELYKEERTRERERERESNMPSFLTAAGDDVRAVPYTPSPSPAPLRDMVFDDEEHAVRRKASARYRESRREIVRERSRLAMQRKRKREREEHVAAAPPPSQEAPPAPAVPPPIYIVVEDTPPLQREVAVTLDTPVEFGMRGRVIEARTPAGAAARAGDDVRAPLVPYTPSPSPAPLRE